MGNVISASCNNVIEGRTTVNDDQHHRKFLERGLYPEERNAPQLEFPARLFGLFLLVMTPVVVFFALKNAVVDVINSIPFLAQFIN